ncbi:hypothetical protein AF332_15010 [Sporosarcina globispora]|uniref:Peptidase S8 n=1 Tax=Sporosarcina globispora TaxID=1459 RepID=A0A0M0GDT5_SPOGL|nr:hypothetical protein AF332_15010 [Sporosarcina globispora]
MGKSRKKKIINVMAAGLTTAVLLGTSTVDSFADNTNAETPSILASQQHKERLVNETHTVTLITGDVVTLEKHSDGLQVVTAVPKEDGTPADFTTKSNGEDYYVIPDEATPFLATGQLDEELFNISKLVEYGYGDANRSSIPLIVTEESGKNSAVSEAAEEAVSTGAMNTVDLPSVDAIAVKTNKKQAKKFWDAVDGGANTKKAQPELTEGIKKIWLDKPVHVLLDKSVPQIGAPAAWEAGYDGKGVKVAVLDTGIDPNHPDFKDSNNQYIVKEAKNFTTDPDWVDHHGHGTHVASTIAGSGAASGGKNKGVAPGAELLVGKVLNNEGSGPESGIIAAMEWAVQEKADIVSMSLGSSAETDGSDPLSQAVNRLSETSETLFVIAAGNTGPNKNTIGAPGVAEKALTVGAVDKNPQEFLASFSSRGPVINNFRVKPEITAPGVGIVAARASGTAMGTTVDDNYTTANGTSMATPHVAGAAAILKQKHPEWTGDHIKQVLTGTALANVRYIAYQQGAGRVDVVKALDANVYGSPAVVSMGKGMAEDQPIVKTFKYVNPSDNDVTLTLEMAAKTGTGHPVPSGMFTLNQTAVTVPAHASNEVKVTFNPALGNVNDYQVVVTATSSDGKKIKTTIGATKTEPLVNLTIKTIGRDGNPGRGELIAFNLDTGLIKEIYTNESGMTLALLQPGRWSVMGLVKTIDEQGSINKDYTLAGEPMLDLKVKEDKAITLDARLGKEIKVGTPKESEQRQFKLGYRLNRLTGTGGIDFFKTGSSGIWDHIYAVPTGPVENLEFNFQQRRYAPTIKASYDGLGGSIPLEWVGATPKLDGKRTLKAVHVGKATPEDLSGKDLTGKLAVVTRDETVTGAAQINAVTHAGAEAVVLVNDRPGIYAFSVFKADGISIPAYTLDQADGTKLLDRIANGPTLITLKGIANSPYVYNIALMVPGGIPDNPVDEVNAENSAVVQKQYRGSRGTEIGDTNPAVRPKEVSMFDFVQRLEAPIDREEWYSTGSKWSALKEMKWFSTVKPDLTNIANSMNDEFRNYLPGDQRKETWLGAVIGPALPSSKGSHWAFRQGDKFTLGMRETGDSEQGHWSNINSETTVQLYQDGKLLKTGTAFDFRVGEVPISPDPATYQVTMTTSRPAWLTPSTKSDTAWTFKSERPASGKEYLPLMWPKYDLDLDAENKAHPGNTDHFDLSFVNQSGETSDISGVEVSVSTDDGNTWSNTQVKSGESGHYTVTVKNPESGYVSLRVKAWDAKGSQVEQTLIRTYAVREN